MSLIADQLEEFASHLPKKAQIIMKSYVQRERNGWSSYIGPDELMVLLQVTWATAQGGIQQDEVSQRLAQAILNDAAV
jgi:hypothetical protein